VSQIPDEYIEELVKHLKEFEKDKTRLDYLERTHLEPTYWPKGTWYGNSGLTWSIEDGFGDDGEGAYGNTLRAAIDWSMKQEAQHQRNTEHEPK